MTLSTFNHIALLRLLQSGMSNRFGRLFNLQMAGVVALCGWILGPFDLTVDEKQVRGVTEGRERMIYMTRPANLEGIPALWIDGTGSAPGYSGHLAVPVMAGRHEISIRAAEQPDLFE